MASSLYLTDIEQDLLGLLLAAPETWPDIQFITREEFAEVRQHLFDVIKQQLDTQQSVAPSILTEKLKSYGQTTTGDVDTFVYLDGLSRRGKFIDKAHALGLAKELKKATVKRQLLVACDKAKARVREADTLDDMVSAVDKTLSDVKTEYFEGGDSIQLFEGYMAELEERGNNPVDADTLGYIGPFPSINMSLGNLSSAANFVTVGARTGGQKSSLSFFWNLHLAEHHPITVLHLDSNEMTAGQIRDRAMCCMSKGEIPLWAIKSGEWRKNKSWTDAIRGDITPRLNKVMPRVHYFNIGNMSGDDVVAFIKRFYYKKVGRQGFLAINLDYIKGMETAGYGSKVQEHQQIGHYINKLKGLVTEQINGCIWTSVQNNRTGIYTGKKADDIVDSEDSFSLSDRIIQQSSHGFVMRFKIPEELAMEKNKFGNIKFTPVKTRELLGKQFEKSLMPVKLASGKYVKNYYNLNSKSFYFEDKGDLRTMMATLGHTAINLATNENDEKMP